MSHFGTRPRRASANRCYERMRQIKNKENNISLFYGPMLSSNIPDYQDAYFIDCDVEDIGSGSDIGDDLHGMLIVASLPFKDDNNDFAAIAYYGNEQHRVIRASALNLMQDDPAYYHHVLGKLAKYPDIQDVLNALYAKMHTKPDQDVTDFVCDEDDEDDEDDIVADEEKEGYMVDGDEDDTVRKKREKKRKRRRKKKRRKREKRITARAEKVCYIRIVYIFCNWIFVEFIVFSIVFIHRILRHLVFNNTWYG